jgi:hypothetical protein
MKEAENFIHSSTVYNRIEIKSELNSIVNSEGKFGCILGGPSIGKSLVLSDLQQRHPDKVFLVNLRLNSSILKGLLLNLQDKWKEQHYSNELMAKILPLTLHNFPVMKECEIQNSIDFLFSQKSDPIVTTELINNIANNLPPITLIIDEANIAFTINNINSTKFEEAKKVLAICTALTKQNNKVLI